MGQVVGGLVRLARARASRYARAMADPINLNKARKARDKADAQARAARNRVSFGRTKAEKQVSKLEAERAKRGLEQKKRED